MSVQQFLHPFLHILWVANFFCDRLVFLFLPRANTRSDGSGVEQPLHGISGRADDPAAEERGAPAVIYLPLDLVSVVSAGGLFELLDKLLLAGS